MNQSIDFTYEWEPNEDEPTLILECTVSRERVEADYPVGVPGPQAGKGQWYPDITVKLNGTDVTQVIPLRIFNDIIAQGFILLDEANT